MFAPIAGRRVDLEPYGLAFTKLGARRKGANPVWYVDRTAGAAHQWKVAKAKGFAGAVSHFAQRHRVFDLVSDLKRCHAYHGDRRVRAGPARV
jgi:hypothetical protein